MVLIPPGRTLKFRTKSVTQKKTKYEKMCLKISNVWCYPSKYLFILIDSPACQKLFYTMQRNWTAMEKYQICQFCIHAVLFDQCKFWPKCNKVLAPLALPARFIWGIATGSPRLSFFYFNCIFVQSSKLNQSVWAEQRLKQFCSR